MKPTTKVVMADDHVLVLEALTRLVGMESDIVVVGTAHDGAAALEAIRRTDPDVLVTDLKMGEGVGGWDLIESVREQHPDVGIVVLSMFDDRGFKARAAEAGATRYVVKEEASHVLVSAIRGAAGRADSGERPRGPGRRREISDLTEREREVLRLLGAGLTTREVAVALDLSVKTVDTHRSRMMNKLGLENPHQLIRRAVLWQVEDG